MTDKSVVQTQWLPRVTLLLALLIVPFVGTACGSNVCKIFNCDTLFFMEDLSQALQNLTSAPASDDAGDEHDDMDMDGEEEEEPEHDD